MTDDVSSPVDTFQGMGLHNELMSKMKQYSIVDPSEIQKRVMVPLILGKDVVVHSHPNSGKTLAYILAILHKMCVKDFSSYGGCQTLILSPLQHESLAIRSEFNKLSPIPIKCYCPTLSHAPTILQEICNGVDIVVGTPGRISTLIEREIIQTDNIKTLLLDDFDVLVSRGFQDAIYDIFRNLSYNTLQVATFSNSDLISPLELDLIGRITTSPMFLNVS